MKRSINELRAWMQSTESVSPDIPDDEFKEPPKAAQSDVQAYRNAFEIRAFQKFYRVFSVVFCIVFILILLITISWMPRFGDSAAPASNEANQPETAVTTGFKALRKAWMQMMRNGFRPLARAVRT